MKLDPVAVLPHGPEFIFISGVLNFGDQYCQCSVDLKSLGLGSKNCDKVNSFFAIEVLAQAAAIHKACQRNGQGHSMSAGYLASIRSFVASLSELSIYANYVAQVTCQATSGAGGSYLGELLLDGELVCESEFLVVTYQNEK